MRKFTDILIEEAGKGLTVFDIDDTLFRTSARVKVKNKKTGDVKELPPASFNKYKLKKDEEWDFGEFKNSKIFQQTAMPIGRMVKKAKAIIRNATRKGSKVIIITARSDMDDRDLFLDTFRAHGIDIDKVHVERAGNLGGSAANAKKKIFQKYLGSGSFERVRFFDDDKNNLKSFLSLKKEYSDIDFTAFQVQNNGSVRSVK